MRGLVIVSCGAAKLDHAAPAGELYRGAYFKKLKAAALALAPSEGWLILSAKYGLVRPDQILEPYEMHIRTPGAVPDRCRREGRAVTHETSPSVALDCGLRSTVVVATGNAFAPRAAFPASIVHLEVRAAEGVESLFAYYKPGLPRHGAVPEHGVRFPRNDNEMFRVHACPVGADTARARAVGSVAGVFNGGKVAVHALFGELPAREHESKTVCQPGAPLMAGLAVSSLFHDVSRPRPAFVFGAPLAGLRERHDSASQVWHTVHNTVSDVKGAACTA